MDSGCRSPGQWKASLPPAAQPRLVEATTIFRTRATVYELAWTPTHQPRDPIKAVSTPPAPAVASALESPARRPSRPHRRARLREPAGSLRARGRSCRRFSVLLRPRQTGIEASSTPIPLRAESGTAPGASLAQKEGAAPHPAHARHGRAGGFRVETVVAAASGREAAAVRVGPPPRLTPIPGRRCYRNRAWCSRVGCLSR